MKREEIENLKPRTLGERVFWIAQSHDGIGFFWVVKGEGEVLGKSASGKPEHFDLQGTAKVEHDVGIDRIFRSLTEAEEAAHERNQTWCKREEEERRKKIENGEERATGWD